MMTSRFASFPSIATAALIFSALVTSACGGKDVYLESTSSKQTVACTIAPGDNVCTREWSAFGADDRDQIVGTVEVAAAFVTLAHTNLQRVHDMCGSVLDALSIPRPTFDATTTPVADLTTRAKGMCASAAIALDARSASNSMLTLQPSTAACTPLPAPSCARFATSARTQCSPANVSVVFKDGATDDDHQFGQIATMVVSVTLQVKASLNVAGALTEGLVSNEAALVDAPCVEGLTALISTATTELSTAETLMIQTNVFGTVDQ